MERDYRDLAELLCQQYCELQYYLDGLPDLDVEFFNEQLLNHFSALDIDELMMTDFGRGFVVGHLSYFKQVCDAVEAEESEEDEAES